MKEKIVKLDKHVIDIPKIELKNLLGGLKMDSCKVRAKRIGINPEQLTKEELENNWYSPKGNMEKWLEKTGGINGLPKGLELDAFAPDRIRDIFASSLKNYIDTRNYLDECRKEYLNNAVYKAIRPYIDKIVQNLVGQKQNDVKIMDFDILDYARKGYSYLPSDEVCCLTDNNIDKLAKDYFRNSRLIYDQSI